VNRPASWSFRPHRKAHILKLSFLASRISEVVINCADPELLAWFRSEVFG
jgi:hypothetical protein